MDATAAGARSPASDGPRPKRRPRSPRTAAPRSQGCATAPYSGSCPTGCCASAKRQRCRCPTWKRPADGGAVTIRASKTDQQGDGAVRFLGTPTVAAVHRYLEAAGITDGPLFRRIRKGAQVTADRLGADSIRAIVRKRAAAVDGITGRIGGHSLRIGSARELAADGASLVELQQAGGWRSPTTPAVYVRRESATRGPVARRRYGVGQ